MSDTVEPTAPGPKQAGLIITDGPQPPLPAAVLGRHVTRQRIFSQEVGPRHPEQVEDAAACTRAGMPPISWTSWPDDVRSWLLGLWAARWRCRVLDEEREALLAGPLGGLPVDVLRVLCRDAVTLDVPAGSDLFRSGMFAFVVLRGVVRAYVADANGRQLTIRYCRHGDLFGLPTLFTQRATDVYQQALTDCRLLVLRPATLQSLARTDVRVAVALLVEVSDRLVFYIQELGPSPMSTVRQRVARCLLDVAVDERRDGTLVARLSQQELAAQVGTVREVVVRVLRELRDAGVVRTERDEIVVLDPGHLSAEIAR
jgi:CRP/FNR family cyclic AMP-dependent transcriptional regulator